MMKRLLPYFPQLENYMINMRLMMEDMPIHLNDLARVTVPSLVLIGGWDLISYEHSLEIANHLGNGHLVSVPFRLHRSEEHTSELQSRFDIVCRLLLEKKNIKT